MEVGLVEEHTGGIREPVLVSQSISSSKEFSPIKIVDNDNKKEGKICEHFSIRGYVADVRKKNAEISWPFSTLHNHKLDEYANLFPPQPESKFRHWNCEHCLHGIDPSAAVVVNGAEGLCQNDEVKGISTSLESVSLASQSGEQSLLPDFQQISEGKMLGEQFLAADSSMSVSNVESCSKVCPAMKENESVVNDLTQGLDIPKAGHDACEVIWNLASDIVATKGREHFGEGTMVLTTNTFETDHGEATPDLLHAKTTGIESVHEISGSKMIADVAIYGQKQYNDIARHVLDIDSLELDESDQDSCNDDMDETENTSQTIKRSRETLIADKRRRKTKKVRLLDDIMRSGGSDAMSKQICSPSEEAEDGQNEDDNDRQPYTFKGKYRDCKSHADQKTRVEPSTSRARHTLLLNEDKGPSMYCPKRASKKVMTHKGSTKFKPKRTTNSSVGKRLDCFHDFSGEKVRKSKVFLQMKKKGMPWCSINPQQKAMNEINLSGSEDAATNIPYTKAIDPQFKDFLLSPQASHHGPKIRDNSHTKDSMHKNKDTAPQVGHGGYCQMHLSKEPKRVPKKKRTGRVSKQVISDDIPMEIVELLARNQLQRRLMEAKAATMPKSIDGHGFDVVDDHRKLVADAVSNDFSQRKNLSCNTVTYLGNSRSAEHSRNSAKHTNHLNLNKEDVHVASIGPSAVPEYRIHPMNLAESPNYYSVNNYFTQNSNWNRERLPMPESCHIDDGISSQKSGRKSHGLSWMPVNLKTVTHERGNQKLVNQDGSHLLNINAQAESSINKSDFTAATSFAEVGYTLYSNQPTPPIHLLKQMNSVAWPGTSHNSVDTNKSGFTESSVSATNQRCHSFTSLMGRLGSPQAHDSSLLVEPQQLLPRVGVFESFLQNEIASGSNTCPTQISLGIGHCSTLKCHRPKNKPEWSYLGPRIRMDGQQIPISGNESTKQLLNSRGTHFGAKTRNFSHSKSCESKGKAKSVSSNMATYSRALNDKTSIYTNGNINHMTSDVNSITRDLIQVNINSEAAVQSPKTEICVINRNPADFTILDKDNGYLIPCEGLGPRKSTVLTNLSYPNDLGSVMNKMCATSVREQRT